MTLALLLPIRTTFAVFWAAKQGAETEACHVEVQCPKAVAWPSRRRNSFIAEGLGDGGQFQSSQQNLMIQNDMPLCAAPLALTDPKVTANSCRTLHSSSFASTVTTLVLLLFGVFPKDPYVTPGWC